MVKELTIQQQIEILEKVKSDFIIRHKYICVAISSVSMSPNVIWKYMPIMKKSVVTEICVKYGIEKPCKGRHKMGGGWWAGNDFEVRIQVIDALINELKKKI